MEQRRQSVIAIDLLRFVAAMLVLGYHVFAGYAFDPPDFTGALVARAPIPAEWVDRSWFGWVGVEIFFVISGYVIARSAVGQGFAGFARRRALRLVPAAWLCATITLPFLLAVPTLSQQDVLAAWLRSVTFAPAGVLIDPSYWTLGIELCFYTLVATRLGRPDSKAAVARLAWWIGGASTLFWLVQSIVPGFVVANAFERTVQLLLLRHGVFFAIGMIVAQAHEARISRRAILGTGLFVLAGLAEICDKSAKVSVGLHRASHPALPIAAFVAALLVVISAPRLQRLLGATVTPGIAARLGAVTYPLYLIHQNLTAWMIGRMVAWHVAYGLAAVFAITVALAVAFALLPLERAFKRAIGGWIDRATTLLGRTSWARATETAGDAS